MDLLTSVNNRMFRAVNEASPFAIFITDHNGDLVYINQRFQHITGYSFEQMAIKGWIQAIYHDDRDRIVAEWYTAVAAELPYTAEFRCERPDGRVIWLKSDVTQIREEDHVVGYLGVLEDITEKKRLKKELEDSYYAYHQLMESTSAVIYSVDKDMRYATFNNAYKELVKRSRGVDLKVGDSFLDVMSSGSGIDCKLALANFKRVMAGEHLEFTEQGGEPDLYRAYFDLSCNPIKDADGHVTGMTVFAQDISERMALQKDRDEQSRILEALEANLPIFVFKVQRNGIITQCDGAGLFSIGLRPGEIKGMNTFEQFPGSACYVKEAMSGKTVQFVNKHVTMDGREFYFQSYMFPDPAEPGGIIGFSYDITREKEAEKEILKAKKQAEEAALAKQQFLSNMSHEIRTPINAVIGMTYLLLQDNPRPEQIENLGTLKFSGENLLALVNDILDYAKIEAGKIVLEAADFNLRDLVNSIRQAHYAAALEKSLALDVKVDALVPQAVVGDALRLTQVLNNLLSNAIKFTEKGKVMLELFLNRMTGSDVFVDFKVTDSGPGIDPVLHDYIFESFTQVGVKAQERSGGTGLGLAITRRLLELQESRIAIKSEPGKGAVFSFRLKLGRSSKKLQEINSIYNTATVNFDHLPGYHMLVVDDNEINILVASKFMKTWGLDVDSATSGREAYDKVLRNSYDLILMDLQMPEMDGYEASLLIRSLPEERYRHIPIIALTADVMPEVKEKAISAGMNDYISKPFNPRELYGKLAQHLR